MDRNGEKQGTDFYEYGVCLGRIEINVTLNMDEGCTSF